jgi:predicted HD phosphohydrolase
VISSPTTRQQDATVTDRIFELLADRGAIRFSGESVNLLNHALQTAELAENEGADDELVLAALLHDLGHLFSPADVEMEHADYSFGHQLLGARFLHGHCAPRIVWLVQHHTEAKRYLCSVSSQYLFQLSPSSQQSLATQGGLMTAAERLRFADHPWAMDAVRLRRWDDRANIPTWTPVPLEHFADRLYEHFSRCWSLTCGKRAV